MSSWISAHAVPLAALTIYLAVIVAHAWHGHRSTRGISDYYVGGRSMGGLVIGLSFYATYFSTNSFIGFAGESYDLGFAWMAMGLVLLLCAVVSWHVVAPRLRLATEKFGTLTFAGFLGAYYQSSGVRIAAAGVILVSSIFYMTAVFKGIGGTMQAYLSVPYEVGVGLVFLIVVAYTVFGGFISVVHTDAVQGALMLLGSLYLLISVLRAGGGWTALIERIATTPGVAPDGRPLGDALLASTGTMPWALLLGIACAGGAKFLVEPRQVSRFFALRDDRALRIGMIVAPAAIGFSYLCLLPIGVLARGLLADGSVAETDAVIPALLTDPQVTGQVAAAVILTALLGAAMSSIDSVLLVLAGAIQRDVVEVLMGDFEDARSLRFTRVQVVVFATVTALVALRPPGDILSLTIFSGSLYAACFAAPLFAALFRWRGSPVSAVGAMLIGGVVVVSWSTLTEGVSTLSSIHPVFASVAASFAGYAVLSRLNSGTGGAPALPSTQ